MAYPFDKIVPTKKKSAGTNLCIGIVIHHTASNGFEGNVNYLATRENQASVHFVIGPNGEIVKIGDPKDILWHAGNGSRGGKENVNVAFMGIEVVGFGEFNIQQLIRLTDLVEYLMGNFPIDRDNIVRHSDVTQSREITKQRILWDGKRSVKKHDIETTFFVNNEHFKVRRDQLQARKVSRYGNI